MSTPSVEDFLPRNYSPKRAPNICFLVVLLLSFLQLRAQDAVKAGAFHIEHPTLVNLGFEWTIEGDANRNATVDVRFRKAGASDWRPALPLLRIGGERVYRL